MELKKKLLETKNITLKQALEKARAWETANIQAKDMASGESKPPTVNYVKHLAIEENSSTITVDESATSRGIECAQQGAGNVPNAMFLDTLLPAVPRGKEKTRMTRVTTRVFEDSRNDIFVGSKVQRIKLMKTDIQAKAVRMVLHSV